LAEKVTKKVTKKEKHIRKYTPLKLDIIAFSSYPFWRNFGGERTQIKSSYQFYVPKESR